MSYAAIWPRNGLKFAVQAGLNILFVKTNMKNVVAGSTFRN